MQRLGALTLLLLMAVVVVASAWLRLGAPRPGCDAWPLCRFEQRIEPAASVDAHGNAAVRAVHRVAASSALLLIVVLGVRAWRRGERAPQALLAALLALALGLAALGIATPGSRAGAVMLGNWLGGALMFALAWALWRHGSSVALPPGMPSRRAALAVALPWIAQATLGVLSGAGSSAIATLAHLVLALLLAIGAFVFALVLRRAQLRGASNALLALLGLQIALGLAAAFGAAPPAAVLLHNAGAALGLALSIGWATAARSRPPGA